MIQECTHLNFIRVTQTDKHVCEDCIKIGSGWVHLRMCLTCGHVGWCYIDQTMPGVLEA